MPASKVDRRPLKSSTGARSSPRKRKQESNDTLDVPSSPSKVAKRAKREPVDHSHVSPRLPINSKLNGKNKISKTAVIALSELVSEEEQEVVITKKQIKNIAEAIEASGSDEVPTGTNSAHKGVKFEVPNSAATVTEKETSISPAKLKRKSKTKVTKVVSDEEDEDNLNNGEKSKKTPKKRKTKEEKEAEAMPLAARTSGLKMFVGAHVSIATGVEKAVTNSVHIGANAFALFLQSQRKWDNKPLLDENRDAFLSMCKDHKYSAMDHILPHGSYLVNLAQAEHDKATQAYDHFVGDLKRCEDLGIRLYNFHPGAAGKGNSMPDAIRRISAQLNRALAETTTVIPVLENMAGSGSVIGSRFSDLRDIIAGVKPEFKSRIGVCIDTCHAFAAGYDLRTPATFKGVMQEFGEIVGFEYLKGLHINDSKAPFDTRKDLHQNIGLGFLGLRAFHNVMNETRFHNMPLILETPCEDQAAWTREIKLLESLIGMDPEGEVFKNLEKDLSDKGKVEREQMQKTMNERGEKAKKKLEKGQKSLLDMVGKKKDKKGKKSAASSEDGEELSE